MPRTFCVVAGEWDGASSAVRRLVSARVRERQRPSQQLSGQSTWRGSLSAPLLSLRRVLSPHGERQSQNHLAEDREGESHDGQRRGHSSLLIRTHLQTAAEGWRMKKQGGLVPRLHPLLYLSPSLFSFLPVRLGFGGPSNERKPLPSPLFPEADRKFLPLPRSFMGEESSPPHSFSR